VVIRLRRKHHRKYNAMNSSQNYVWRIAKRFFNALPDKTDETATVEQISDGVTFRGANLWVLIFAIFIACLGLNLNSTAVIIGAMLISPLMGPIIGMGLAVGRADLELLKRSLTNYGVSTVISVLTAALYFQLTPLTEAQSELLARTSPTLYDVLIALFGAHCHDHEGRSGLGGLFIVFFTDLAQEDVLIVFTSCISNDGCRASVKTYCRTNDDSFGSHNNGPFFHDFS